MLKVVFNKFRYFNLLYNMGKMEDLHVKMGFTHHLVAWLLWSRPRLLHISPILTRYEYTVNASSVVHVQYIY